MNNKCLYIIYDLTRLLTRFKAATPSGIDRIDLNYLLHITHSTSYRVVPVYQFRGAVYLVPEMILGYLVDYLACKWVNKRELIPEKGSLLLSKYRVYLYSYKAFLFIQQSISNSGKSKLHNWLVAHKNRSAFYLNVSHHGLENKDFFELLKAAHNVKLLFCLSDLIPIDHPEFYPDETDSRHAAKVKLMVHYADVIIVISEYTQKTLHKFCNDHQLLCPATQVLKIGVEDVFIHHKHFSFVDKDRYVPSDKDYFVIIGTIEPRKNHLLLLNLWRKMVKEDEKNCPLLVVVGKRGWCNQHVTAMLDRCESLQNVIIEISGVDDEGVVQLLKRARALLAPSFDEGWGMPVAEALSVGTPVIASDIDAFKESGKGLVESINPLDSVAWENKIRKYCLQGSDSPRAIALNKLSDYSPDTWENYFSDLEIILMASS